MHRKQLSILTKRTAELIAVDSFVIKRENSHSHIMIHLACFGLCQSTRLSCASGPVDQAD